MPITKNSRLFLKAIKQHIPMKPCEDHFFGTVDTQNKRWIISPTSHTDYNERCKIHKQLVAEKLPVLVILLESPHKDEFENTPYMPAKGNTGKNLLKYFAARCPSLPASMYKVLLVNVIQYQCSLGVPTKNNRTDIFLSMWEKTPIKNSLTRRLKKCSPAVIINCCTKGGDSNLRVMIQNEINEIQYENIPLFYHASHPSFWKQSTIIHSNGGR